MLDTSFDNFFLFIFVLSKKSPDSWWVISRWVSPKCVSKFFLFWNCCWLWRQIRLWRYQKWFVSLMIIICDVYKHDGNKKINEGTAHSMLDSFTLHLIDSFRVAFALQLYCSVSLVQSTGVSQMLSKKKEFHSFYTHSKSHSVDHLKIKVNNKKREIHYTHINDSFFISAKRRSSSLLFFLPISFHYLISLSLLLFVIFEAKNTPMMMILLLIFWLFAVIIVCSLLRF